MDKCHLTEKYNEAWERLSISMPSSFGDGQTPTNPLLLAVPEAFKKANVKILFLVKRQMIGKRIFPI